MTRPVKASAIPPQTDKSENQKREEAARRAVSRRKDIRDANARSKAVEPNEAERLRAGLEARDAEVAGNPRARAAVRKAQVSEAVKARFADRGIGGRS